MFNNVYKRISIACWPYPMRQLIMNSLANPLNAKFLIFHFLIDTMFQMYLSQNILKMFSLFLKALFSNICSIHYQLLVFWDLIFVVYTKNLLKYSWVKGDSIVLFLSVSPYFRWYIEAQTCLTGKSTALEDKKKLHINFNSN